ncbi:lipoprotein [Listeria floridensis FSL S10-1187]|uniref:Lipoprotein n=1 Tax=Listeria floridensis FSL S10-1187 TaxID=1265817 RepID=A0ABN0RF06_9LIST|nr:hypothetical protein [Listeria floridensis]EUJ31765.1 lipoprotein [Listeria floridensis FSL S10-1187]
MKINRISLFFFLFIGVILVLSGCQQDNSVQRQEEKKTKSETQPIQSVDIQNGDFIRTIGWLSNNTVLLQKQTSGKTYLIRYQIFSGKSKTIFETSNTISEIKVSPDYEYFFVYAASNPNQAGLTIYDSKTGDEIEHLEMEPLAANFYWNQETPEKIMIVTYEHDFTFQAHAYNFKESTYEPIPISSPFVSWYSDHFYLENRKSNKEELGNLYLEDTRSCEEESLILANILQFATNRDLLITMERSNRADAVTYDFHTTGFQTISKYEMPREYDELGTFIPYFDLNFSKKMFASFEPYKSRKLKTLQGEYKLIVINPLTGKKSTVMELLDNRPLLSSPNGKYLLYGYQFERVIDVKQKKMSELIVIPSKTY